MCLDRLVKQHIPQSLKHRLARDLMVVAKPSMGELRSIVELVQGARSSRPLEERQAVLFTVEKGVSAPESRYTSFPSHSALSLAGAVAN